MIEDGVHGAVAGRNVAPRSSQEAQITFDFEGDLYGQALRVEFIARLREVRRFNSVEALVEQLRADEAASRKILSAHP